MQIIPIFGKILLGNPKEYRMLWTYTNSFENSKNAAEIFAKVGLVVEFNSYFYGCASGFYGQK